jgi:uncharacterized protein (UPF0332 family)
MSWSHLLASRTIQMHTTSKQEIDSLRELVSRDLKDAEIVGLSEDRCFATAYNAVLQLSKIAIACAGYRVSTGAGHHQKTFESVKVALGAVPAENLADYFETCRRKRNKIDYDAAEIVSETEARELLEKAREFQLLIEAWIAKNHAAYKK